MKNTKVTVTFTFDDDKTVNMELDASLSCLLRDFYEGDPALVPDSPDFKKEVNAFKKTLAKAEPGESLWIFRGRRP